MLVSVVTFKAPPGVNTTLIRAEYQKQAERFRGIPGLLRKYFIWGDEAKLAGGVYLWESRAAADAVHTPEWAKFVKDTYGATPEVVFFEVPVVVDNQAGKIEVANFEAVGT